MQNEIDQIYKMINWLIWNFSAYLFVFEVIPMTKNEEIHNILNVFSRGPIEAKEEAIKHSLSTKEGEARLYRLLSAITEAGHKFDNVNVLEGCNEEFVNKIFAHKFGDNG